MPHTTVTSPQEIQPAIPFQCAFARLLSGPQGVLYHLLAGTLQKLEVLWKLHSRGEFTEKNHVSGQQFSCHGSFHETRVSPFFQLFLHHIHSHGGEHNPGYLVFAAAGKL